MSFNFWDTYPLPPLSTVRGWFHQVVEAKEYIPIAMSIQGKFQSIVHDLQTLIKFDRPSRTKEKGYPYLESFNKSLSKTPTYVANVYGIELTIYIKAEENYLKKFINNVFKKEYPSLGRYEDLFRVDDVKIIEPDFLDLYEEPIEINYGIYLNKTTADSLGLRGINYRINFKYDGKLLEKTGLRYFKKKDVVYVDGATLEEGEILFDKEKNRIIDLIGDE